MDENHRIRGIYTVCKFIMNATYDTRNQNRIITKTLGKFGVVDTDYQGPCPNHDEFWLVKIVKEIKAGTPMGCIVLTPIMKLERNQIRSIVPNTGMSTVFVEDGICYVTPNNQKGYFLIPLEYRKSNKDYRVTICVNPGFASGESQHSDKGNPYVPRPQAHGWDEASIRSYTPN